MKLLVSCIPWDGGRSGISAYIRGLVGELRHQGHELTLLCEPAAELPPEAEGLPVVRAPRWASSPVASMLWHLFALPRWLRRHRGDFHAFVIAAANRRVCSRYPIPTVAVVHDLASFRIPGKYSRLRMFYLAHILPHYAKKAHHLVAVSESTAADMLRFWHCPPGNVTVLHEGFPAPPPGWQRDPVANLLVYVSRLEHPGKNHVRLIEAYGRLPRDVAEAHPLVFAGADWKDAATIRAAADASPHADLIGFAGFLEGEAMENLWAQTGFYVFPSLFEGFGISLAEAMARGIPCACSGNGSLAELAGGAAETFDPENPGDIAAALERLFSESPEARTRRIARGRARAAEFSWAAHVRGIVGRLRRSQAFGVDIDCDTNDEAVRFIRAGGGTRCAFVNAHCLNMALVDGRYRNLLNWRFDRVWPDGTGVRMAGRHLGFVVPENVNGTDLFPLVAKSGGLSFWFLGGKPGVAEEALKRAQAAWPESRFLGASHGYHKDWGPVFAEIAAAKPDVLLVALGVPLQEKWISGHVREIDAAGVGCTLAVGGLLDFVSGRIGRAPVWVRRHGAEWLWRLAREPFRLFRRYVIGNCFFLYRVDRERCKRGWW